MGWLVGHSVSWSVSRADRQTNRQSVSQLIKQLVGGSVTQSVGRSVEQTDRQSVNQAVGGCRLGRLVG